MPASPEGFNVLFKKVLQEMDTLKLAFKNNDIEWQSMICLLKIFENYLLLFT